MTNQKAKQILTEALRIKYTGDYKSVDFENTPVGTTGTESKSSASKTGDPANSGSSKGMQSS